MGSGVGDHAADTGLDLHRVFLRDHAAIQPESDLAGHDVGVGSALDPAYVQVRVRDAFDARRELLVRRVLRIQGVEDVDRALQRVNAGMRDRCVCLPAVHGDFHLQAAVVGGNHFVGKPRRNHQVGFRQAIFKQPARPQFTAKFLVVGEMQLDTSVELGAQRFKCANGKGKAGEIALADSGGTAINLAV